MWLVRASEVGCTVAKGPIGSHPTVSIERAVAFRPALAIALGDVKAALLLSQALWKQSTVGIHEWWPCTRWEWEGWTGMRRREQDRARKVLRERGLLAEQKARANVAVMYCVDVEAVNALCPVESAAPNVPSDVSDVQTLTGGSVPSEGTEAPNGTGGSVHVHTRIMRSRAKTSKTLRLNNAHAPASASVPKRVGEMLGAERAYRGEDIGKKLEYLRMKVRGIESGADVGVPMAPHVLSSLALADGLMPVLDREERAEVKALQRRLRAVRC